MMIIGCDFHTRYQQIAGMDEATGELTERRLDHQSGEAHAFYRNLQGPVRVGIEATGPIHWFERLLAELGHELWIGDAAKIRASEVRKQKTDERDALLILELLLANRFPKIWVPTPADTRRAPLRHAFVGGPRHQRRPYDTARRPLPFADALWAKVCLGNMGASRLGGSQPRQTAPKLVQLSRCLHNSC